jgi:hypothetical protein
MLPEWLWNLIKLLICNARGYGACERVQWIGPFGLDE